mmetsp:Transcript_66187/g.153706  ORF Transcript_66187/g.153706 Transcript_66187/m.153706 type:complete len:200 (+) Transcript_66187:71-670(+)
MLARLKAAASAGSQPSSCPSPPSASAQVSCGAHEARARWPSASTQWPAAVSVGSAVTHARARPQPSRACARPMPPKGQLKDDRAAAAEPDFRLETGNPCAFWCAMKTRSSSRRSSERRSIERLRSSCVCKANALWRFLKTLSRTALGLRPSGSRFFTGTPAARGSRGAALTSCCENWTRWAPLSRDRRGRSWVLAGGCT